MTTRIHLDKALDKYGMTRIATSSSPTHTSLEDLCRIDIKDETRGNELNEALIVGMLPRPRRNNIDWTRNLESNDFKQYRIVAFFDRDDKTPSVYAHTTYTASGGNLKDIHIHVDTSESRPSTRPMFPVKDLIFDPPDALTPGDFVIQTTNSGTSRTIWKVEKSGELIKIDVSNDGGTFYTQDKQTQPPRRR